MVVSRSDGTERRFVVTARREYAKPQLPVAEVFTREGP